MTTMNSKLLQIQMPEELRDRLREIATSDRRSMTAEALVLIEDGIAEREDRAKMSAGSTQVHVAEGRRRTGA
jgi:predicted DNA-binding protein